MHQEIQIKNKKIGVKIANNIFMQTFGLMFRKNIDNYGMLFVFKNKNRMPFTTLFTLIPLDIIWIDENKKVIGINKNTFEFNYKNWYKTIFKIYVPQKPYKYALEVKAGFVDQNNISSGDDLKL